MEENKVFTNVMDVINNVNGGNIPSLKAFALVLEVPTTRLYAVSKKPIAGQVYDPSVINWEAVNDFLSGKLSVDGCAFDTMESLVLAAQDKDEWLKENATVRVTAGANMIDVDGGKMPKRKAAMFEMGSDQESLVCFKHDAEVYKMIYQTLGYTCIRAIKEDGSFAKEEVRVVSNSTLNTKCVSPLTMKQAIADRFSGAYAAATESDKSADSEEK